MEPVHGEILCGLNAINSKTQEIKIYCLLSWGVFEFFLFPDSFWLFGNRSGKGEDTEDNNREDTEITSCKS
jgi:hypothetical protein